MISHRTVGPLEMSCSDYYQTHIFPLFVLDGYLNAFNSFVSTKSFSSSLLGAFRFQHRYFFFCKAPRHKCTPWIACGPSDAYAERITTANLKAQTLPLTTCVPRPSLLSQLLCFVNPPSPFAGGRNALVLPFKWAPCRQW